MDNRWSARRACGDSRRGILAALLGLTAVARLKPRPAAAIVLRRCCSAICRGRTVTDRRHVCVPVDQACPPPPAGYRINCEAVLPRCGDCGKEVCPARDR